MFIDKSPGRTCVENGKEYLFFSGYSYLGMNGVAAFISNIKEGIDKYGLLFPSSRNSNTKLGLYRKMEDALSNLISSEDSVIFSSGYLAGQTIAYILGQRQNIFIAPGTHPSIIPSTQKAQEESFTNWINQIVPFLNNSLVKECILIADSVNIFEGRINNFSFVKDLRTNLQITFLIDDSHGIGILGENGGGILSTLPKQPNIEYIISYSLSKAFHIQGGAVSASISWCNRLREHPHYSASTSISPALAHGFLKSPELYRLQRLQLEENITEFINFTDHPKNKHPIPIFPCSKEDAADILLQHGMVGSSFSYPIPGSVLVNRVILNSLHTKVDIHRLADLWHLLI